MLQKKKSFWAKITGLSEEELQTEAWENFSQERNKDTEEDKAAVFKNRKEEQERISIKGAEEPWLDERGGQLAVDVYQTEDSIVVKSAIAGVKQDDLDITIANDVVTIRGKRETKEKIEEENCFYKECYWGKFSRSIILPCEIKKEKAKANLRDGILTIVLPKTKKSEIVQVKVKEKK